jgi:hypothetical protein
MLLDGKPTPVMLVGPAEIADRAHIHEGDLKGAAVLGLRVLQAAEDEGRGQAAAYQCPTIDHPMLHAGPASRRPSPTGQVRSQRNWEAVNRRDGHQDPACPKQRAPWDIYTEAARPWSRKQHLRS